MGRREGGDCSNHLNSPSDVVGDIEVLVVAVVEGYIDPEDRITVPAVPVGEVKMSWAVDYVDLHGIRQGCIVQIVPARLLVMDEYHNTEFGGMLHCGDVPVSETEVDDIVDIHVDEVECRIQGGDGTVVRNPRSVDDVDYHYNTGLVKRDIRRRNY
jgi:hypothetical protein